MKPTEKQDGKTKNGLFNAWCGIVLVGCAVWLGWTTVNKFVAQFDFYSWQYTKCEILDSRVDTQEDKDGRKTYAFAVRYRYGWKEHTYECETYSPSYKKTYRRREAAELVALYAVGEKAICYVDPADPSRAILLARRSGCSAHWKMRIEQSRSMPLLP